MSLFKYITKSVCSSGVVGKTNNSSSYIQNTAWGFATWKHRSRDEIFFWKAARKFFLSVNKQNFDSVVCKAPLGPITQTAEGTQNLVQKSSMSPRKREIGFAFRHLISSLGGSLKWLQLQTMGPEIIFAFWFPPGAKLTRATLSMQNTEDGFLPFSRLPSSASAVASELSV